MDLALKISITDAIVGSQHTTSVLTATDPQKLQMRKNTANCKYMYIKKIITTNCGIQQNCMVVTFYERPIRGY